MPQKQGVDVLAAGGVNVNILQGWQYEYLPFPARIKLLLSTETPTTATDYQMVTVFSGSETIMEESPVSVGATVGVMPSELNYPAVVWDAPAGDRIRVQRRNTDTASKSLMYVIYIYPLH